MNATAPSQNSLDPQNWISRHGDFLVQFARQKVRDRETAEDLVQDTFVSAWNARERFRGQCSERTWLVGVLRNKIVDHYRRTARRPLLREVDMRRDEADQEASWMDNQPDESTLTDPVSSSQGREFYHVLDKAITRLPDQAAAAFRMRELEGYSTEEITEALNISRSNLWVLIHRAKASLKDQLQRHWLERNLTPEETLAEELPSAA